MTPPTPPTAPVPAITTQATQRTDAQIGIDALKAYRVNTGGGGFSAFAVGRGVRAALGGIDRQTLAASARRPMASSCSNGTTTSTQQSGSTVLVTIDVYYDVNCLTSVQSEFVWTASQQGSALTGPMTLTEYTQTHTVAATGTGAIELLYTDTTLSTLSGISILIADLVQNGVSEGGLGIACDAAATNAAACSVAVALNDAAANLETGATLDVGAAASGTSGSFSMQIAEFQAGLDGLTLTMGAFPSFVIAPASAQTASASVSASANASTGSYTLAMTDSLNDGSLTISGTTSGPASGTIVRDDTGATVASFTVDASGNGTLTYGNGTQVPISNYAVQG